ncbi:velvet factor [Gorgonomyces haynaldii]|nr:velvet factor [Gorgonomyces haynaldii]
MNSGTAFHTADTPIELSEKANVRYELVIRQQPLRGRMSGNSMSQKRDRRLITPPLILQLVKYEHDTKIRVDESYSQFLCHLKLVRTPHPKRRTTSFELAMDELLGTPLSECVLLTDDTNRQGMFFIFPDLGIVSPGFYQISCQAFRIDLCLF